MAERLKCLGLVARNCTLYDENRCVAAFVLPIDPGEALSTFIRQRMRSGFALVLREAERDEVGRRNLE